MDLYSKGTVKIAFISISDATGTICTNSVWMVFIFALKMVYSTSGDLEYVMPYCKELCPENQVWEDDLKVILPLRRPSRA